LNQRSTEDPKVRHIIRFVSGVWSKAERNYDAGKLELRALVQCVRKLRLYLYGVRFTVETDASVLVAIINRVSTDLPGALVQRWLAWLHLFDFDIRHVRGTKNGAADALSRQPEFRENIPEEPDFDLDDWVDVQLNTLQHNHKVMPAQAESTAEPAPRSQTMEEQILDENGNALDGFYTEEHHEIARWLATQRRPPQMSRREFTSMKRKALQFVVQHRQLFHKVRKSTIPLQRVIDDKRERQRIIDSLHDEFGHKGRDQTFWLVFQRYWWPKMYEDVRRRVKKCDVCQRAADGHYQESLRAMPEWPALFWRIHVDCTGMPESDGKNTIVQARCSMSLWVEARALKEEKSGTVKSSQVAKFLYEEVICNHGVFGYLITDGGSENRGLVDSLMALYGIKVRVISPLNSRGNGLVEVGHKPFIMGLRKGTNGTGRGWTRCLHSMKLADRCTVKKSTGYTPAYLVQGREYVLPIEADVSTIRSLDFSKDMTTEDLLFVRMRQIDLKNQNVKEAIAYMARRRLEAKEVWDEQHERVTRPIGEQLAVGDLVLVKNVQLDKGFGRKLEFRWLGPYKIVEAYPDRNYYQLAELDGAQLKTTTHGDRLKKYHQPETRESTPESDAMDVDEGLNVEIYDSAHESDERSENAQTSEDDESPSAPPMAPSRRSSRLIDRRERERQRRIVEGLEAGDGPEYDPEGARRPVAAVILDQPPEPLSRYRAVRIAYHQSDVSGLSRWEKCNRILKAESYYNYPDQVRRESRKLAQYRRKAIVNGDKEPSDESDIEEEEKSYADIVLAALRKGKRVGHRNVDDGELWCFD